MQTITSGPYIRHWRPSSSSPFSTCSQQSHSGQNSCPPAKCYPGWSRTTRVWSVTCFALFWSSTCSRPSSPWWSAHTWTLTTASHSSGGSVFSSTEFLHSGTNLMLLKLLFVEVANVADADDVASDVPEKNRTLGTPSQCWLLSYKIAISHALSKTVWQILGIHSAFTTLQINNLWYTLIASLCT